jgi:hypothetical protein
VPGGGGEVARGGGVEAVQGGTEPVVGRRRPMGVLPGLRPWLANLQAGAREQVTDAEGVRPPVEIPPV